MSNLPLIGITPDFSLKSAYSNYPHYLLRQTYSNCILQSGGIPIILPYDIENTEDYINLLDGLLVTGGDFDIAPELYGATTESNHVKVNSQRTKFEWDILKQAIANEMPILGICGGEQLINVILGGDLVQHIPDEVKSHINHEQTNPKHEVSHEVNVINSTLLHNIIGKKDLIQVNSTHHQAVKNLGQNLRICAQASDGIIEAIEHTEHPFCLGVQWHPDHLPTTEDKKIIQYFIEQCQSFKNQKA